MSSDPMTLFAALDPAAQLPPRDSAAAWNDLLAERGVDVRRTSRRRVRSLVAASTLGLVGGAVALVAGTLTVAPLSAAAATLQHAARLDAGAAVLPALQPGQTLNQVEYVSMTCEFSSPSMGNSPALTYVSAGSVSSSTDAAGVSTVTISPSAIGTNSGHFATPSDEARWVAGGRPFIPCALGDGANQLIGNAANVNQGSSYGGYAATVSGYSGLGYTLAANTATIGNLVSRVNVLPSDPARLASMLAAGEIAPDGTTTNVPHTCSLAPNATTTGCDATQQVQIVARLLQLPDASAKLGAAFYQVAATLPGSQLLGSVTTPLGVSGTAVVVPLGINETLELVIDPATGALLECVASAGGTPMATVSYGPLTVSGPTGS